MSLDQHNNWITDMCKKHMEYHDALKELWRTVEGKGDWQLGYNPEFTKACERLRQMDQEKTK